MRVVVVVVVKQVVVKQHETRGVVLHNGSNRVVGHEVEAKRGCSRFVEQNLQIKDGEPGNGSQDNDIGQHNMNYKATLVK